MTDTISLRQSISTIAAALPEAQLLALHRVAVALRERSAQEFADLERAYEAAGSLALGASATFLSKGRT